MKSNKVNKKNFNEVLDKFVVLLKRNPNANLCEWLNDTLDEFLENDFFGTEGQLDPRGDHRG